MLGRWNREPRRDIDTGKWLMVFEIDTKPVIYDETKNDVIVIQVDKYREDRSDRANRYFHKLVQEIAKKQKLSMRTRKDSDSKPYGRSFRLW